MVQELRNLAWRVFAVTFSAMAGLCLSLIIMPVQNAYAGTAYPLYVGGVQVTVDNMNDVLGDGTVSYVAPTSTGVPSTLILNNAHIEPAPLPDLGMINDPVGIWWDEEAISFILLRGENSIGSPLSTGAVRGIMFENSRGLLNIGEGVDGGSLSISTADPQGGSFYYSCAIDVKGAFNLGDTELSLYCPQTNPYIERFGLCVSGLYPTTIEGSLHIRVEGADGWGVQAFAPSSSIQIREEGMLSVISDGYAINPRSHIELYDNGMFEAHADGAVFFGNSTSDHLGLYTGNWVEEGKGVLVAYNSGGLCPASFAWGEEDEALYKENEVLYKYVKAGPYFAFDVWVGVTPVTSLNYTDVLGDGSLSYDPILSRLSLNNFNSSGYGSYGIFPYYANTDEGPIKTIIYARTPLCLVLQGHNEMDIRADNAAEGCAIFSTSNLSIISNEYDGNSLSAGAYGQNLGACTGIHVNGDFEVAQHAVVHAWAGDTGTDRAGVSSGVHVGGSLTVRDGGSLFGQSQSVEAWENAASYGIYCTSDVNHSLSTYDDGCLQGQAGAAYERSYGICRDGRGAILFGGRSVRAEGGFSYRGDSAGLVSKNSQSMVNPPDPVLCAGTLIASTMSGDAIIPRLTFDAQYLPLVHYGDSPDGTYTTDAPAAVPGIWGNLYIFVEPMAAAVSTLYAPGLWLVKYQVDGGYGVDYCPAYQGKPMLWNAALRSWCYLMNSEVSIDIENDFAAFPASQKSQVAVPGHAGAGDVNLNDTLNIVDAQIAYDMATGGLAFDLSRPHEVKRWLTADVTGDGFLDAPDSFALQSGVLRGFPVG